MRLQFRADFSKIINRASFWLPEVVVIAAGAIRSKSV